MAFPVDILATVDPDSLEQSAKDYMSELLYRNSEIHEYLSIPGSNKIEVGLCNVSFVPLYGVDIKQKVLALFSPEDPFKAVGLYLLDQWWSAEDILKTADSSRTGLIKVRSPGERIVLYVLNRIMYRTKEIDRDDLPFLCHGEDEIAKILWKNGEAVGFYSVKPEGKLCNDFLTQRYQLPVMDTIFIRKCHRSNGHGLQLLKDFVHSFRKDVLGLKYPLSPAMYKVCKKYLSRYPEDTELLWEVDGVGSPFQRTLIARKLKAMDQNGNRQVAGKLNFDTEDSDVPMEVCVRDVRETMAYTEVVDEVVQIKITEEVKNMPVSTRDRSSSLKCKTFGEGTDETAGKIIRVEDTESDIQCAEDELACEDSPLPLNLKENELKDTIETMTCDVTPILEITHLHCEGRNKLTREPIYQSETERVANLNPVLEIESLKHIEDAQILQTFTATIAPVDLHPLELEQEVKVAIVKRSSETEESVEITVFEDGVKREMPSDESKHSEAVVKAQKYQIDTAETFNKEDTEDGDGMGKMSVIENIVEDTGDIEVDKVKSRALKEKYQHEQVKECFSVQCVTEDQELSHDNKEVKINILIQQEENLNIAYGSGSEGKQRDELKSRHSRRLEDKTAKGEQTERILRSSSKKTLKATSKQVDDETTEKGLNQTESLFTETEQVVEMADHENVDIFRDRVKNRIIEVTEVRLDKTEIKENADTNQMEEAREEELMNEPKTIPSKEPKITYIEASLDYEVDKTNKDDKKTADVKAAEIEVKGKVPQPSSAEPVKEREDEPTSEVVPAETGKKANSALKLQKVAVVLVDSNIPMIHTHANIFSKDARRYSQPESADDVENNKADGLHQKVETTEKEQEVEMAKKGNVTVGFMDKIQNSSIEGPEEMMKTEVREITMDVDRVSELTVDKNKMEDQEEKAVTETTLVQDTPEEEIKSKDISESDEDGGGGVNDQIELSEEEKDQTNFGTLLRYSRRLKHHTTESELTKRVPSSVTKAISQQEKIKHLVKAPELEQMKKVGNVDEKIIKDQNLMEVRNKTENSLHDKNKLNLMLRNEEEKTTKGKEGVNQTECETEPSEILQAVTEDEEMQTHKLRDQKMNTEENMSKVEDKFPKSDEKKINKSQEEEVMQPLCIGEELIIQGVDRGEDDEGLKSVAPSEEEEDKTSFLTPSRWSKRRKHQLAESEPTKRVLRSAAKATNQPELESHTETSVEEKIASVSIATETGNFTTFETVFKGKIAEQSAAETVTEHEEESSAETEPAEGDNTEGAMSGFRLENVTLVLEDNIATTPIGAGETSQSQEKVDLELHKSESIDTESQTEHTKNEQVVKKKETDEKVKSQEGAILNNGNEGPESAVTDKQNIDKIQNNTSTAQETHAEELRSLHAIESCEEDERPDVIIKLDNEDEASSLSPLRRSRMLQDQAAESELTKSVLRRSARLTNKSTQQQRPKQQIKAMMMTNPEPLDDSISDDKNIIVESEVPEGELVESKTEHVFDQGSMISAVQSISEEESKKEKEDDDHMNVKSVSISCGNEVEENISSVDVREKDKMAPKEIIHGEAEQICTSGGKSPVDRELSEAVKEIEGEVIEKARGEDENVMEATTALALQEASVVLVDVKRIPMDHLDLHNTEVVNDNISVEEQKGEQATDVAAKKDGDREIDSTCSLKLHKATIVLVDLQIHTGMNELGRNEAIQLQEVALPNRANQERTLVEISVKEPVTERKEEEEEEAVERVMDHRLNRNDEQNRNVVAEEGVSDYLKEEVDSMTEKSASTELDINKTMNEYQESTTASHDDSVQESTRDEETINPRCGTLPVKPTPERKSRQLQNTYEGTKFSEKMDEDNTDEEVETVLTRNLRWRTVTVTPIRRSKPLTGKHVAKLVMKAHESEVCQDVEELQSTEKTRNVVEETHETNSKCVSEEGSAVSKAETKDQQQDKNIPETQAGIVEERIDKGGGEVEDTADRTDQDHVEGHQDENDKIRETDEPNREQVRSANTKQDHVQEETFEKGKHLEEGKDKNTINLLINKVVLDESEEGVGVDRKAQRKRTITSQADSVRRSKRLRKQDHGGVDEQRGNTEESAPVEVTVADVRSQIRKETPDQEIETVGQGMCLREKNQENAEGGETSGNANNSQKSIVTEVMRQQVRLSEMLNVSEEDTDIKLVAQEKAKGKVDRKKELVIKEVREFENSAGKADKVADEPREVKDTQELKYTQEEAGQSEENAEGMTEASVNTDEYFTLELDDEMNSDDTECNQVIGETNRISRSRKSVTACNERKSARRRWRLRQDGPTEPSETEDKSEAEEAKEVIREEEKKPQQKRKVGNVDKELTPRRSKRLAREEIMSNKTKINTNK